MLSGGQVQRVALARALYNDPALIVLDEPNSNLDTAGDNALTQAIAGLRTRGKTVIVMAHRPSAIVAVEKLLMVRDGKPIAKRVAVVYSQGYGISLGGLEKLHPFDIGKYHKIYSALESDGVLKVEDVYVPRPSPTSRPGPFTA